MKQEVDDALVGEKFEATRVREGSYVSLCGSLTRPVRGVRPLEVGRMAGQHKSQFPDCSGQPAIRRPHAEADSTVSSCSRCLTAERHLARHNDLASY